MNIPIRIRLVLMSLVLFLVNVALAEDSPINTLLDLPAVLENQEMLVIEVQLAPGEASPPHRHNAYVYVYMLEGEVEMQVRGGKLKRLRRGDVFYESPDDIHQVGRNVSATMPAKFLVHMIKKVGAPVTVPVEE